LAKAQPDLKSTLKGSKLFKTLSNLNHHKDE